MLNAVFLFYTALELQRTDVAAFVHEFIVQFGKRNKFPQLAQIFDHFAELLHRCGTAGQGRVLRGMAYHIIQRRAVLDGKLHGGFDRFIANLAGRRVDDTAQTQLVCRIFNHPQVGEHILNLGAREEVAALVHAVRNACADECGGNVI